jgi:copper transport protein
MSGVLVRSPRALTSTGYGWTLVAKVVIVLLVVAVAVYNRQRLVPAIAARLAPAGGSLDAGPDTEATPPSTGDVLVARSRTAWGQLRRTTLLEVVGLALVLALTGFLVSQRPAAEAAGVTGAYEVTATLTDDLEVDLIVDPSRAGRNAVHVYVLDATGRPAADVEELRLELTYVPEDIGPFELEPFAVGPGHWTATIDELAFAGEWQVRVIAGIDRFAEATAELPVVVDP